jgi:hypothetical protein
MTSSKSYDREGHINTGLSTNITGYAFAIDAGSTAVNQSGVKETKFHGSSDFVIAYRLAKITFHKKGNVVTLQRMRNIPLELCWKRTMSQVEAIS